jgi:hypothetical protein
MIKDHERFSNIASGIQNIVLVVAIIIGGLWTAYTFSTLSTKSKAEAELTDLDLRKSKAQAEITELDLRNSKTKDEIAEKGAVIDIKLEAKQEPLMGDEKYCIAVLAKVTNTGVKNTIVDLSKESPLTAYLISFDENGSSNRTWVVSQSDYSLSSTVVRSGYTIQLPLFIKVRSKGLYILEFKIKLDRNEILIDNAKRGTDSENIYWMGSTYVLVK